APAGRTISVSGTGKVTLTPDIAYVSIGVHTEAKDAKTALSTNNTNVQKVVNAIKGAGVDAKDIQTTNFNIYPSNQYGPNGQVTETKYAVDNTVYVTVRKLDGLGSLLDTVVTAGANTVNGIQFDVADKSAATSEARKQAIQDARKQAEELAAAAGVKVGEIQSISIFTNAQPLPYYQNYGKGMGGGAAAPEVAVPISSGQMILTADVSIVYAIQ
ncbi:MAG TPA: SIMPL domain-containing protein, partial [Anaerolineaceae bacterium]|nr:SIMPL domain-containing protein [Anaerolineaceae bacterium]